MVLPEARTASSLRSGLEQRAVTYQKVGVTRPVPEMTEMLAG
jgi:hypothetical protein